MLRRQLEANFIGRQEELLTFEHWFNNPSGPHILYLYDSFEQPEKKGGVGKTWLLRKFMQLTEAARPRIAVVLIDFFDASLRDGVAIAERVAQALEQTFSQWAALNFKEALKDYQADNEKAYSRPMLARALNTDLQTLQRQLKEKETALLLLFDTFEIIENGPTIAVLNTGKMFPDDYTFPFIKCCIASRNRINWEQPNWLEREQEIQELSIKPFNQQEMSTYLYQESIYDFEQYDGQLRKLYKLTEGRPILVGLLADVLNHRTITIEELVRVPAREFEANLVSQIHNLENPLNWVVLFMAHVYHRFNTDILWWIFTESPLKEVLQGEDLSAQKLMDAVPRLSFVRRAGTGDNFVLHDEMRRLVRLYCWTPHDPDLLRRKELSACMIRYFEQASTQIQNEQERQMLIIETLYHTFFLDLAQGLAYFNEQFDLARKLAKYTFARNLLQETQQFVPTMTYVQKREIQMTEAILLRMEERAEEAIALYAKIRSEADPQWLGENEADILWEEGRCYNMLSNFPEAITSFTKGLAIQRARGNEAQVGTILNMLGYTHRNQGEFDKAQAFYEEALKLYTQLDNQGAYADIVNNLSLIEHKRGKTELALRRCKIGLRIRRDLFKNGKAGEFRIALSLSTMGQIFLDNNHTTWATQQFNEAFDIYTRLGRKREIAATYNRFGQIEMAKENYEKAREWLEKAGEASIDINKEAYINSLNKQGRLSMTEGKWPEAVSFLELAVNTARKVRDAYQETESLLDLAHSYYHLHKIDSANKYLNEAKAISERLKYDDLLGKSEEFLGDVRFDEQNYEDAFTHYRKYCYYMALRSEVEYNKAINVIIDRLFDTPGEKTGKIVDDFIAYWTEQKMDGAYPELETTLQDVRNGKFLENLPGQSSQPRLDQS